MSQVRSDKRFSDIHRLHMSLARRGMHRDNIQDGRKLCSRCEQVLPLSEFDRATRRHNGYQIWCKKCGLAQKKATHASYRAEANGILARATQLKRQYGITLEQYDLMLEKQNGVCWICRKPESQRSNPRGKIDSLRVDHCHRTGMVRGLLCCKCNFGISQFNDDPCLLENAIKYLTGGQR